MENESEFHIINKFEQKSFETVNLTQAIVIVSSYRTALKKFINQLKKEYTQDELLESLTYNDRLSKVFESLCVNYHYDGRLQKLSLVNKFDSNIKATAIFETTKQQMERKQREYSKQLLFGTKKQRNAEIQRILKNEKSRD